MLRAVAEIHIVSNATRELNMVPGTKRLISMAKRDVVHDVLRLLYGGIIEDLESFAINASDSEVSIANRIALLILTNAQEIVDQFELDNLDADLKSLDL